MVLAALDSGLADHQERNQQDTISLLFLTAMEIAFYYFYFILDGKQEKGTKKEETTPIYFSLKENVIIQDCSTWGSEDTSGSTSRNVQLSLQLLLKDGFLCSAERNEPFHQEIRL